MEKRRRGAQWVGAERRAAFQLWRCAGWLLLCRCCCAPPTHPPLSALLVACRSAPHCEPLRPDLSIYSRQKQDCTAQSGACVNSQAHAYLHQICKLDWKSLLNQSPGPCFLCEHAESESKKCKPLRSVLPTILFTPHLFQAKNRRSRKRAKQIYGQSIARFSSNATLRCFFS